MKKEAPAPIARAGEVITCENGHPIYEMTTDVFLDNTVFPSQVKPANPLVDEPFVHDEINIPCPECGAAFSMTNKHGGVRFHFSDGYR